nr:CRISPR system precrRNA processing endoribonuclease RAMP protein Cas6 [Ardenticatena sp.]
MQMPMSLEAQLLEFTVTATTPLELPTWPGSALRGALLGALRRHYCPVPEGADSAHTTVCPVCWLMAREDRNWRTGRTPARPYTIMAPGGQGRPTGIVMATGNGWHRLEPGDPFTFRVALFGVAKNLLPYLILAVPAMGRTGVGRKLAERRGLRGQFALQRIEALNPLTGERQMVFVSEWREVIVPTVRIDQDAIDAKAAHLLETMQQGEVHVVFHTPTRVVDKGRLLKTPHFRPLFQRLLERVEGLAQQYSHHAPQWDYAALVDAASRVQLVHHDVEWVDIKSGSRRTKRVTPLGGFIGRATYKTDDWRPLLPILLWGCAIQVGKDTVKGNGVISVQV